MSELLSEAVEAHGGLSRWREISSLEGRVAIRNFQLPAESTVVELGLIASTHQPLICLEDLGNGGLVCSFTDEEMRLYRKNGDLLYWRNREDLQAGRERRQALDVEDVFRSSPALWIALNAPFVFTWPGFVTREISAATGQCGPVRRLLVGFPPGLGSNMQVAIVCIDNEGLMRSMRYPNEPPDIPVHSFFARGHAVHDGIVVGAQQLIHAKLPRPDGSVDRIALSLDIQDLRFR